MVLIIGEMILITIPIVVYVMYKVNTVKLKKMWLIIPEIVAILMLLFSSFRIVTDIPYLVNGGKLCEDQIEYITETGTRFKTFIITMESGREYTGFGDIENKLWIRDLSNNSNLEIYVLPNTQLVYKIECFLDGFKCSLYSIYDFNFEILILCLFEFVLILMFMKFRTVWGRQTVE